MVSTFNFSEPVLISPLLLSRDGTPLLPEDAEACQEFFVQLFGDFLIGDHADKMLKP